MSVLAYDPWWKPKVVDAGAKVDDRESFPNKFCDVKNKRGVTALGGKQEVFIQNCNTFFRHIQASFSLLCTPHTRIIIIIQPVEEAASEADAVRDGADVVSGLAIVGRDTDAGGENSMKP